jgi:hypothetical protein
MNSSFEKHQGFQKVLGITSEKIPSPDRLKRYCEWALDTTLRERKLYWKTLKKRCLTESRKKLNKLLPLSKLVLK